MKSLYMCDGILILYQMITRIIDSFSYSHHTRSIQNTVFGYKKTKKIESIVFSIEEHFISFLTIWFDNQIGVLIVKKNLQIKYHAIIYTIFISIEIVRKSGQKRDFAKFHSTPKN